MDNRLLIGFAIFLAVFLGAPIVVQQIRGGPEYQAQTDMGFIPQKKTESTDPELNQPPLLNEQNLVGTEWAVIVENYKVKITLAPGGVCYATHPMAKAVTGLDYLEGRWRVEYDKLYVQTSFGGQVYSVVLKISGNNIYYGKDKIQRF